MIRTRTLTLARAALAAVSLAAASAFAADVAPPTLARCERPLASVMVGKLQCKAANCGSGNVGANAGGIAALLALANGGVGSGNVTGIADGIRDVLTTALAESGCFDVQDRDALNEIEQELARAGKKVQTQQAEYLISGAVTQIEVNTENKSFGGGFLPLVGSIGTKTQKAEVALDMKLVNIDTAKVVASKRASASSENSSFAVGGLGGAPVGGSLVGFGGTYASLKGTNLEAVTKDAIVQSVNFLVETVRQAKGG